MNKIHGTKIRHPRWLRVAAGFILVWTVMALAATTSIDLTYQVHGTLPVANGGTGSTTATGTAGSVVLSNAPTIASLTTTSDQTWGQNAALVTVTNDTTTGTTANLLAKLTASGKAIVAATTDTSGELGVVEAGAGTSGNASIAIAGIENCVADNATTIGDYVGIGTTTAGRCRDVGSTRPTSGQIIGLALSAVSAGANVSVYLFGPGAQGATSQTFVYNEVPTGSINGSNVTFTLAFAPSPSGSLICFENGLEQAAGGTDFTLSSNTITYGTAPASNTTLRCNYTH